MPDFPSSDDFVRQMGQITWLMTISAEHSSKPISYIERLVSAALMMKQARVILKEKQPLAAIMWAFVTPDIKRKITGLDYTIKLQDWRSGPELVVVDCISPFVPKAKIIKHFEEQVRNHHPDKMI
jgi:hemolysin-activating ACP:hemolysin acyltransferase